MAGDFCSQRRCGQFVRATRNRRKTADCLRPYIGTSAKAVSQRCYWPPIQWRNDAIRHLSWLHEWNLNPNAARHQFPWNPHACTNQLD